MQRNSSYLQILEVIVILGFLFLYQLLSSVFSTLPPLLGLFFTYAVVKHWEKDRSYKDYSIGWYIAICYLFLIEQIHGFELFSVAISFGIFYYFLFDTLVENIKFRDLSLMISVLYGYLATFFVSNFLSYLKDESYLNFGFEYVTFIFIEATLSLLLFKGRII